jgi:curved DNA-binding protein CbpA
MFQFVDYYALLDIDPGASSVEILAAFDTEAKSWHPGRYPSQNGRKVMQDILEAKRVLLDPVLKASYDTEYFRLKDSNKLPDSITVQSSISDIDSLLNELIDSTEHDEIKQPAINDEIIDQPEPNVSDDQLLHVVNNAYSYHESFVQFAQEILLKRNFTKDFISEAIRKSSHTNSKQNGRLTLVDKLLKSIIGKK